MQEILQKRDGKRLTTDRPSVLHNPIEFLKGVGPLRSEILSKELSIKYFKDLLFFFPFRYIDRTRIYKIKEVNAEMQYIQLCGVITDVIITGLKRKQRIEADLEDDTGRMNLVWFQGGSWVVNKLKPGIKYIVFGKPNLFKGRISIAHPSVEGWTEENLNMIKGLQPVYSSTEALKTQGLDSSGIVKLQRTLISKVENDIKETLPSYILDKLKLMPRKEALRNVHLPANQEKLAQAQYRLKFEELLYLQLRILRYKAGREDAVKGFIFSKVDKHVNDFYKKYLPFPLTEAQKKVVREIRNDMGSGKQMNRLLQGDVGSGKTLVALLAMLIALDNGFQCCLMAPTEILAVQHYATIREFLKDMPVQVSLITGSTKESERELIHSSLENGEMQIIVGTHALIEDRVKYKNLGLIVIDEQHRFGVNQRARLWRKNDTPPHVLVMTATPIPRTLAMTIYGDLEVSVIDQLPPGRIPIKTYHRYDTKRREVYKFLKSELSKGRQCYIIYPFIEESEHLDIEDLENGYMEIQNAFPGVHIAMVHGRIKATEREKTMALFEANEIRIIVATTVIEVGVNIPNASVIVIESSQKFGLSQLHQLRGRVGRSTHQSYCVLMTPYELGAEAKARINTMVKTTDGFEISEEDLRLRGPGDIMGTQQSGLLNLKIADLAKDSRIVRIARVMATEILNEDRNILLEKNSILSEQIKEIEDEKGNWSRIS